jgi:dATP pyrophosphohydrolase
MKKRSKIQVILFYRDASKNIFFLLLQTNEKRGSFWQNITGGVDKDETFEQAAFRELEEETSITKNSIINVTPLDLIFNFHDQWGYDVTERVFSFEINHKYSISLDPTEHQDFKWSKDINCIKFKSNQEALREVLKLN